MWVEVNRTVNYPLKEVLNDMNRREVFDFSDPRVKFCVSSVTCQVAAAGVERWLISWNEHTIPGKPKCILLVSQQSRRESWTHSRPCVFGP